DRVMNIKIHFFAFALCLALTAAAFAQTRTITVSTNEPNAVVWLNDIRYGTTDSDGHLTIKNVSAGTKKLRVRAAGFKETTQNLTAVQKGEVKIALTKTDDEAELAFQQA